ncbi:CHAD domain-containing protein, partial [Bacteroidota bacterium]
MSRNSVFEIHVKEAYSVGIQRILQGLNLDSARLLSLGGWQHVSIHSLRKNIKKIRALLQMIKPEIGEEPYKEFNKKYREIAHKIAGLRDYTSQIVLLKNLQHPLQKKQLNNCLAKAARQIAQMRKHDFHNFYSREMHHIIRKEFNVLAQSVATLKVEGRVENVISDALHNRYQASQSAMQKAFSTNLDEDYHDWRKDAKNLMYQLSVIRNIWPEYFLALILELDK